ncbi:MAG: hypothetical protein KGJ55_02005 [Gammaproteobacteria bacterium]|nr:hypothetical protein [Gammaproteobacteria bacterium]
MTGCRAPYPFLRTEFFLPWAPADCELAVQVYLQRMLGRGLLLRDDNGWLRRPAVATPAFGALAALGRLLGETLERYAMALLQLLLRRPKPGAG